MRREVGLGGSRQRSQARGPGLRHLGEGEEARARILAALGVVGRGRDHGVRPVARRAPRWRAWNALGVDAETRRIAADLVQRQQPA